MFMDKEDVSDIKLAVAQLYDTPHGLKFIEFLEDMAGKYKPNYEPTSSTSVHIAAGRAEIMATIRNLHRLTEEQILELFEEGA